MVKTKLSPKATPAAASKASTKGAAKKENKASAAADKKVKKDSVAAAASSSSVKTDTSSSKPALKEQKGKAAPQEKQKKEKKPLSAYNLFVQRESARMKEEDPSMTTRQRFAAAATLWADSPENPKRGQPKKARKPKANAKAIPDSDDASALASSEA
ncbi:unnamed protein product [Mycena citricolor]|uniref:HMG box domain-containing protein n=1 Tax=Mycena citricolor TaxID=2018698 RepID=A0AAD2HUZ9_9AGAR|nr:unnamed protein product [Mycena citricolor]CAK5282322.1 unnamed protein product [Mycena citricolor]